MGQSVVKPELLELGGGVEQQLKRLWGGGEGPDLLEVWHLLLGGRSWKANPPAQPEKSPQTDALFIGGGGTYGSAQG